MADATGILNEISGALDGLANNAVAQIGDDRIFTDFQGWNAPAMNRHDLAEFIRRPVNLIHRMQSKEVSDADMARLSDYPRRIQVLISQTMPQLSQGNAFHVYVSVSSLVDALSDVLRNYTEMPLDLAVVEDRKLLPAAQIKSLRNMAAGIERLRTQSGDLEQAVAEITAARAVAESLPADMQTLVDARASYQAALKEIEQAGAGIGQEQEKAEAVLVALAGIRAEAEAVLRRANAADSAATTVGLGKAFADRATGLNFVTFFLAIMLIVALGGGGYLTYQRVEFAHKLMLMPGVSYQTLWLNLTYTALSVSAPVWAAWLLTRQIGQRFRLAEDYGYKAAVAKAYEGYRAEAAQIDQELAKRLFSIALDRLSEAPLRLVEKDSPGSPAHEVGSPLARWLGYGGGKGKVTDKADSSADGD